MVVKLVERLSERWDFELPKGARAIMLTLFYAFCIIVTAGVLIGYGQLYPILVDAKVFHYLCNNTSKRHSTSTCPEQDDALTSMYNTGAITSVFVQGIGGFMLDMLGPKITALSASVGILAGCLLMAYSSVSFNAYVPGFALVSGTSPLIFMSSMDAASLFPEKSGLILTLLEGCYSGGAFIFFIFNKIYFTYKISLFTLFLSYGGLIVILFFTQFFFWPWQQFSIQKKIITEIEEEGINGGDGGGGGGGGGTRGSRETRTSDRTTVDFEADLQFPPQELPYWRGLLQTVLTPDFLFLVIMIPTLVLKANFFLATYNQQLEILTHDDHETIEKYSTILGILIPSFGIGIAPMGLIPDYFGINVSVTILLLISIGDVVCALFTNLQLLLFRFVLFSLWYPFTFATWVTFIAKKFGYRHFGGITIQNLGHQPPATSHQPPATSHHVMTTT
eukprot:TRINITY_DN639_c0_g3_i7.p1 TRINITY_DN639_c0_g3~~TRINITY_DN639_c0_g3_i7.p1  ORF type:complete len:448 (+),score=78.44 TRINITY_DN639_c0_g3_i7:81-1424(+)